MLNATLTDREDVAPDLFILRVVADGALFEFAPGQYAVLGLPGSAPRAPHSQPEDAPAAPDRIIRRAYSIAASSRQREYLEFYIKLVRSGALTPRLALLKSGDRLWLGPKAAGQFTISDVPPRSNLVLVATGTGLAPYLSMIRTAHRCHDGPHYTVVHGARNSWDLGYRAELEALDHGCGTFVYVPTVSRPDPEERWGGHTGRVKSVFEDGTVAVDPEADHIFLCGAPEMIDELAAHFVSRGFTLHGLRSPGNLHFEKYW